MGLPILSLRDDFIFRINLSSGDERLRAISRENIRPHHSFGRAIIYSGLVAYGLWDIYVKVNRILHF